MVLHNLKECLKKRFKIRLFSKKFGLPTWDKPAQACLASRIPYGNKITEKELTKVDKAENFLRRLGLRELRVRNHGEIARIEVPPKHLQLVFKNSRIIVQRFKGLGFTYITLDLQGYRMGSLNEVLKNDSKSN